MVTECVFITTVIAVGIQRLLELKLSKRNEAFILRAGGREHAPGHFAIMRALHILWLMSMVIEVLLLRRPFHLSLALSALPFFLLGQWLRHHAIKTLGSRWTVRIMTLPGELPVHKGIYRYIRHPNYLGVILEIFALPLLHSAYFTCIFFTVANGLLLIKRIREEEKGLEEDSEYSFVFRKRPRFLPRWL